ncbi:unnamed protein product [Sphagnum balticum]
MFTVRETAARGRNPSSLLATVESGDDGGVAAGSLTYMGKFLVVIFTCKSFILQTDCSRGQWSSRKNRV